MRISNISTGNKLNVKTFGELKVGDTIYWVHASETDITNATWTVSDLFGKSTVKALAYTDLNPEKSVWTKCDVDFRVKKQNHYEFFDLPSAATYMMVGSSVYATSQETVFQVFKRYNIKSQLV